MQEASFLQLMAVGKFRSGKVGAGEEGDSKPSEKRGEERKFITYLVFDATHQKGGSQKEGMTRVGETRQDHMLSEKRCRALLRARACHPHPSAFPAHPLPAGPRNAKGPINLGIPGPSQVALVVKNLTANAGDIRDLGSIPRLGRSPGEGHGNPLQYSCLENPMDSGAWWATVHRVAQSRTRLKQLSTHNTKTVTLTCYLYTSLST